MSLITDYLINAFIWGLIFNLPLLFIIIKLKLLTRPGGTLTGAGIAIIMYVISPFLWVALLAFFLTSSLLSKQSSPQKLLVSSEFEKDSTRDSIQVLANSFPALLFGIAFLMFDFFPFILSNESLSYLPASPLIYAAFTTIATHNSDTWMTEIGINASSTPRLITNLKREVPKGTSGGVTIKGTSAGLAGSMIISIIFFMHILLYSNFEMDELIFQSILLVFLGTIGGLIDSLEGATIQGLYYCENCQKVTEKQLHKCGSRTRFHKGFRIMTNDLVNVSSAIISGILALLIYYIIITIV